MSSGGATALRRPTTALPQARLPPLGLKRTPNAPVQLPLAQPLGDRLDLGPGRADLLVVDLGPDHRVHQLAHALGERAVERALAVELLEGQVFLHVAGHAGRS